MWPTPPTLVTGPAAEPVTLTEAKSFLRLGPDTHNPLIENILIPKVRQIGEKLGTWRAFINQTWRQSLEQFPTEIPLPKPPLSSVTDIKYYDNDGALQTLATSVYEVSTDKEPGVVTTAYGQSWPSTRARQDAVQVTYVAGYGAAASNVPASIRHAILVGVHMLYYLPDGSVTDDMIAALFANDSMRGFV